METKREENASDFVREVTAKYIGPRRRSPVITSPDEAADFIRSVMRDDVREHFVALYLNGANRIASFSLVSIGGAVSAPAHPREVFQPAVLVGAVSLIVGHNHPSGDPTPSSEDRKVTKRLQEAGTLLSIALLDHVIVTHGSYYSFKQCGEL